MGRKKRKNNQDNGGNNLATTATGLTTENTINSIEKTNNGILSKSNNKTTEESMISSSSSLSTSTTKKTKSWKRRRRNNRNKKNINNITVTENDNDIISIDENIPLAQQQHQHVKVSMFDKNNTNVVNNDNGCSNGMTDIEEEEDRNQTTKNINCYNEVIMKTKQQHNSKQYVHESWLMDMHWIQKQDSNIAHVRKIKNTTPYRHSNDVKAEDQTTITDESIDSNIAQKNITSNDIKILQKELNELKLQLEPACSNIKLQQLKSKRKRKILTESKIFEIARNASNPFEILGSNNNYNNKNKKLNIFCNRSAIKLSNINSLLNHTLLSTTTTTTTTSKDDYIFIDLCGAPGGFSEYILHTLITQHKDYNYDTIYGFGMSLQKNDNGGDNIIPWKIQDSIPSIQQSKTIDTNIKYKICNGRDKTGDINNWSNVIYLRHELLSTTSNKLAQLIVADGGINEQRNSSKQEEITIPLILSQVSAASILLRKNGNFVLKLFGCQTIIIKQIMHFLLKSFKKIMIVKPISSRPASLERYIVCYGWKYDANDSDNIMTVDYVLSWRNEMLQAYNDTILQQPKDNNNNITLYKEDELVSNYLNVIDYNILQLNIQVCRAILSYLEQKQSTSNKNKTILMNNSIACHSSFINVDLYRKAWRL